MSTRKIFTDEDSTLQAYVNKDQNLFMEIIYRGNMDSSGFIVLSVEDAEALVIEIKNYIKEIRSSGLDSHKS